MWHHMESVSEWDHHCLRWWLVACLAPSHHLIQPWRIVSWTDRKHFNEILFKIQTFSFKKMQMKILAIVAVFSGRNVLRHAKQFFWWFSWRAHYSSSFTSLAFLFFFQVVWNVRLALPGQHVQFCSWQIIFSLERLGRAVWPRPTVIW